MNKPTLFVGSSSESLDIAYAAQKNLEDVAEVVVWTQGIFELSKSYLESLLDTLDDSEFGLFIFGFEDISKIRGAEKRTARDNVVFELGLFIGRLGREHSFILMPKGVSDFHLPSDLLGIATATFQPPSRSDRLQAALGPACHDIRTAIRRQAVLNDPVDSTVSDFGAMIPLLIPEPEQKHLINIFDGRTKNYRGGGTVRAELRHLRTIGLIQKHANRNIGELTAGSHDIGDIVELTDLGRRWAKKLKKES
jgi:hypothetical protein